MASINAQAAKEDATKKADEIRSTTTSFEPDTDSSRITLPVEVLRLIVRNLGKDDNSTLAKCMLVSSTLNALSGPVLYHTLYWNGSDIQTYPLNLFKGHMTLREPRLSRSKLDFLQDLHRFEMGDHKHTDSCKGLDIIEPPLPLEILKLGKLTTASRLSRCDRLKGLAPRKLLAEGAATAPPPSTNPTVMPPLFPLRRNLTSVLLADYRTGDPPPVWHVIRTEDKAPRQRRAVLLVRSFQDTGSVNHYGGQTQSCTELRAERIMISAARFPNFPKQVVIVNSNILPKSTVPWIDGKSSLETSVRWMNERVDPRVDHPADPWRRGLFTEGCKPTFKFISLKKYMRVYDWEGEFTAEEAATWQTAEPEEDEEESSEDEDEEESSSDREEEE